MLHRRFRTQFHTYGPSRLLFATQGIAAGVRVGRVGGGNSPSEPGQITGSGSLYVRGLSVVGYSSNQVMRVRGGAVVNTVEI